MLYTLCLYCPYRFFFPGIVCLSLIVLVRPLRRRQSDNYSEFYVWYFFSLFAARCVYL